MDSVQSNQDALQLLIADPTFATLQEIVKHALQVEMMEKVTVLLMLKLMMTRCMFATP